MYDLVMSLLCFRSAPQWYCLVRNLQLKSQWMRYRSWVGRHRECHWYSLHVPVTQK